MVRVDNELYNLTVKYAKEIRDSYGFDECLVINTDKKTFFIDYYPLILHYDTVIDMMYGNLEEALFANG